MARRKSSRRGILLLIVLSLLVLFALIGVTFVVVATQYRSHAKAISRQAQHGDDPSKELDSALYRLVRSTSDPLPGVPADLLNRHSLLGDLYGVDGFRGEIAGVSVAEGAGEFVRLTFAIVSPTIPKSNGYYNGSVLTLISGQGQGHSTRVVRYMAPANGAPGEIVVAGFEDLSQYSNSGSIVPFVPGADDLFFVNGRPFNGTGDGYDVTTGKLNQKFEIPALKPLNNPELQIEMALLPNLRNLSALGANGSPVDVVNVDNGGSDESWDAVDYQNFFLARLPTDASSAAPVLDLNDPLIPSFHRPFLINYWIQRWQELAEADPNSAVPRWDDLRLRDFRRLVIARPLPEDHPRFTGSNPAFSSLRDADKDGVSDACDADADGDGTIDSEVNGFLRGVDLGTNGILGTPPDGILDTMQILNGPWDVDNDADGVPDSIWVDLGMPVKTAPDGRLYKPLFAVLCVDLDGRLNLNAHGVKEFRLVRDTPTVDAILGPGILSTAAGAPVNPPSSLQVTRGQGYGPAEIRLDKAIGDTSMDMLLARRYVEMDGQLRGPGYFGEFFNGVDLLSYLQQWSVPRDFSRQFDSPQGGSLYMTPSDLRGVGGVYRDINGQGQYALMGVSLETDDDPYELNLLDPQSSDRIFGVAELEQLLRFFDLDAETLNPPGPDNLRSILSGANSLSVLRRYTTHSSDIPVANVVGPNESIRKLLSQLFNSPNATVGDMVRARLAANGMPADQIEDQVRLMVSPEIRNGGRMDINRWLGNGRDDTTNQTAAGLNVVDEPNDVDWGSTPPKAERFWSDPNSRFDSYGRLALDDPNYPNHFNNPLFSRQQYARHLYCMAMLLLDSQNGSSGNAFTIDNKDNNVSASKLTARRIAQWAINTVDFRDPDAIMTPFEFDLNPFDANGWAVDEQLSTDENQTEPDANRHFRAVVWGCEFPELLITETSAIHNRRVRNTSVDNAIVTLNKKDPDDAADDVTEESKDRFPQENQDGDPNNDVEPDQDLDQYRIPQGSLFLELYCPRGLQSGPDAIAPSELYTKRNGRLALDLGRVVNGSPVWRIAIATPDLDDPGVLNQPKRAVKWPALASDLAQQADKDAYPNDAGVMARLTSDGLPDSAVSLPQQVDRYIVFSPSPPTGPADFQQRHYYYRDLSGGSVPSPLLEPGQYTLVGPRPLTRFTSKPGTVPPEPGEQRIVLRADGMGHYGPEGTLRPRPLNERPPQSVTTPCIVCAADLPPRDDWIAATSSFADLGRWGIGINVSEPVPIPGDAYYPPPNKVGPGDQEDPTLANLDLDIPSYYDETKDNVPGDTALLGIPDVPLDEEGPLGEIPTGRMTGTQLMYRVALLQRLADPTRGYDATTNPYITVDSQTIDLTVYNGEEDSAENPAGWNLAEAYDPSDDSSINNLQEQFGSRERGNDPSRPIVWNPVSTPPGQTNSDPLADEGEYWDQTLRHTLGYLNTRFGLQPLQSPPLVSEEYIGAPPVPFPWLTWNNRPFVSPLELMLVPSSPPWRLGYEFRLDGDMAERDDDFRVPVSFLLNFFHSSESEGDGANLCRIFDFLETPSPFVGTRKWLNPQMFGVDPGANPADGPSFSPIPGLKPDLWGFGVPFNHLSRFRDPGRINLNTIPDETVWGAVDPEPTQSTSWSELKKSLQGNISQSERPAFYANPFRSASSAGLMPLEDLEKSPMEASLLRSKDSDEPLFGFESGPVYADPQSSPYFRYHKLQRLGNLVTTHSNVYAVWITVGYFEVLPWSGLNPADAIQVAGYQLSEELGSDTGQIQRHRAFYIIDRSIPVAFEPGENHNVDRAILLRRMIE